VATASDDGTAQVWVSAVLRRSSGPLRVGQANRNRPSGSPASVRAIRKKSELARAFTAASIFRTMQKLLAFRLEGV
jgi:hypothetical protein